MRHGQDVRDIEFDDKTLVSEAACFLGLLGLGRKVAVASVLLSTRGGHRAPRDLAGCANEGGAVVFTTSRRRTPSAVKSNSLDPAIHPQVLRVGCRMPRELACICLPCAALKAPGPLQDKLVS